MQNNTLPSVKGKLDSRELPVFCEKYNKFHAPPEFQRPEAWGKNERKEYLELKKDMPSTIDFSKLVDYESEDCHFNYIIIIIAGCLLVCCSLTILCQCCKYMCGYIIYNYLHPKTPQYGKV